MADKELFTAVGLMSGTSMDGVDAALVRIPAGDDLSHLELAAFHSLPYPDELRASLKDVAFGEPATVEDIAVLHTSVAVAFASAFHTLCRQAGIQSADVDFIGSHGQTVAHVPPAKDGTTPIAGTLQLGPPGAIASLTGVTTVGDFRVADMALGGQGAPLAPYADYLLHRSKVENRVILNVGGISNVTYLPANCSPQEVIAFDTGPGNMVLDELYRVLCPQSIGYGPLDESLASGRPSSHLVDRFLEYPYFDTQPPKSTGHREFGGRFAWEFLSQGRAAGLSNDDILVSAVSLTARSIHGAISKYVTGDGDLDRVYVTGGGARNQSLMEELSMFMQPIEVLPIEEIGVSAEAKEAVDFAVLARETLLGRPNVIPWVTGASRAAVLGTIAWGGSA